MGMGALWLLIMESKYGGEAVLSGLSSWRYARGLCCLLFDSNHSCLFLERKCIFIAAAHI